jgi:protein AbiQ
MIQPDYLDYLRRFDAFVSRDPAHQRKFVGIILEVNQHTYFAPLSSPKPKHQKISDSAPDIVKLENGRLGVIHLNNMIPVIPSAVIHFNINAEPDEQYRNLLTKQMIVIRKNQTLIKKKAKRLHQIVISGKPPILNARCCNYLLLEQISSAYETIEPVSIKEIAAAKEAGKE